VINVVSPKRHIFVKAIGIEQVDAERRLESAEAFRCRHSSSSERRCGNKNPRSQAVKNECSSKLTDKRRFNFVFVPLYLYSLKRTAAFRDKYVDSTVVRPRRSQRLVAIVSEDLVDNIFPYVRLHFVSLLVMVQQISL